MAKCMTGNCQNVTAKSGRCKRHHTEWWVSVGKPCTKSDGCTGKHYARRLCQRHYNEWRTENGKPCTKSDGCTGVVHGRGMCKRHHARWLALQNAPQCKYPRCRKPGVKLGRCQRHHDEHKRAACKVDNCNNIGKARGLCDTHYRLERAASAPLCKVYECSGSGLDRGLCQLHYGRARAAGQLTVRAVMFTPDQRIAKLKARATVTVSGCWEWPVLAKNGYPRTVTLNGRRTTAHRAALEAKLDRQLTRAEPAHHVCANPPCINPEHLQAVTPTENTAEMLERRAYKARIAELEKQLAALAS